jgi:hypothetical protein
MASLLYEVRPTDPQTFAIVAVGLLPTALVGLAGARAPGGANRSGGDAPLEPGQTPNVYSCRSASIGSALVARRAGR